MASKQEKTIQQEKERLDETKKAAFVGIGIKGVVAKQGSKFMFRDSDPCGGQIKQKQNRHFPAVDKLHYDNYLVGVNEIPNRFEYQFTLADGANCGSKGSEGNWRRL